MYVSLHNITILFLSIQTALYKASTTLSHLLQHTWSLASVQSFRYAGVTIEHVQGHEVHHSVSVCG